MVWVLIRFLLVFPQVAHSPPCLVDLREVHTLRSDERCVRTSRGLKPVARLMEPRVKMTPNGSRKVIVRERRTTVADVDTVIINKCNSVTCLHDKSKLVCEHHGRPCSRQDDSWLYGVTADHASTLSDGGSARMHARGYRPPKKMARPPEKID